MSRAAVRNTAMRGANSGMVLVMALIALAVMMVLLLALFQGASHQTRGAQSDASLAREKMLADSAVALVIGQIRQASSQAGQAWISQPGLLRTYAATASRTPTGCYKLYSVASTAGMIDASGNLNFFATDVPSNWSSEPNQYTDLNSPAQTPGILGQTIYPILDPAAVTAVQGVSIDAGYSVQMPVAWLYELQDGTLGPAGNGTAANPIVARIAFWTDDDTSKININTAGSGSAWNTPRVNSTNDVACSTTQPAAGEFSAYPGHPATTSLAVVFGTNSYSPQQLLGLTPRYAWGGSQFGAQATTPGEMVPVKTERLYASLDELRFSSSVSVAGQRQVNPVTAAQLDVARFVLTAHSQAPETTLLGEPRVAIWPVADSTSASAPRITATDRAVETAGTVGVGTANTRSYYFERHNAQSATDDLNASIVPSNAQLLSDLVARGNVNLPGYATAFSTKYPGANWTQIMLEITDFIRGLNPVDPSPAPFIPYAEGDSAGVGRAFIVPLLTTYGSGASKVTLRGMGRCPTLSSLTLVFYVCGFGFSDGTVIDYDATPDDASGTSWKANFAVGSPTSRWKQVKSALVRAFVVPCTFHPGCAYPEVSDACDIQISGLNGITVSSGTASGDFGFAATANSRLLSDALTVLPSDRTWGGNEGPVVWRAAALDAMASGTWAGYPFAGTRPFAVPLAAGALVDSLTSGPSLPQSWARAMTFNGVNGVTVNIRDRNGVTLQTLSLNFPAFSIHAPTVNGECDHADGATPAASRSDWTTNAACQVLPSYYMNLRNRLLATQLSRAAFIQAGDISRSVEAGTDLRVIAGLASVPSSLFHPHPNYSLNQVNSMGGSHAQNIRFADGTSACFAPGNSAPLNNASSALTRLVALAPYPTATLTIPVHDWRTGTLLAPDSGTLITPYTLFTSPPCSVPTGNNFVTMAPNMSGDWDTGTGFSPDGALINLPDSGTTLAPASAYFSLTGGQVGAATQRTPNALIPSPVIFGSLPAGINPAQPAQSVPWRTLLFCPYPAANASSAPYAVHPGSASPPDHLILDNFWMPVVEPYAIGACMATAGKINLNDQIAPFTYLHRNTALRALLDDLRIPAISVSAANGYKSSGIALASIWNTVDENATVAQIENRFAGGSADAYLSESEICTVPLVPQGQASTSVAATQTALASYWNSGGGQLTGDNLRELPYAQLYGRLTTRSNSYTVHIRVQILQKLTHDPNQNVWNEGVDLVKGDWRGSYEIERYLDPAATAPVAGSPLGPYKFRIVSARQFAP
jgi:uncharacterized protein (TIGR02600 family)